MQQIFLTLNQDAQPAYTTTYVIMLVIRFKIITSARVVYIHLQRSQIAAS